MDSISVRSYYEAVQRSIIKEIEVLEASDLDGTNTADWIKYYMEKYALLPIQLKSEAPILEERVEKYQRGDLLVPRTIEHSKALIGLPVEPNIKMKDILKMRGNEWTIVDLDWEYRDNCIFIESNPTSDAVTKAIEYAKKNLASLHKSIETGNSDLPKFIQEQIKKRKEAVGVRTKSFVDLANTIGAELRLTSTAERRQLQLPQVKESLVELRKPRGQSKQIPRLSPDIFGTILEVIEGQALTFERTPQTIAKLDEDDIRNLILSTLNGTLNLGALGEAFSKQGKTDIYMVVPEGGIFIAECKIWRGQHVISEALGQILGYLTWRDAYGVVLLFSRNKGFSGVLDSIPAAIKESTSLRGNVLAIDEHHWSARHILPEDEQQTIEINYLVYNVYAEA